MGERERGKDAVEEGSKKSSRKAKAGCRIFKEMVVVL